MDVLAALEHLEEAEAEKRRNERKANPKKRNPKARPKSLPPPKQKHNPVTPPPPTPRTAHAPSLRQPSPAPSSRRISFAEPDRPSAASRRLWIPTRKDSLASGFAFDPRLQKYGVSEQEWGRFSDEVVEAAEVPGHALLWRFRKKEVMRRIKKELQYEGGFKKRLRVWNRVFRNQGFQTDLALPGELLEEEEVRVGEDGEPLNPNARRDGRRFRMVVTPNAEKVSRVYSRTSSLTRSVTGEALQRKPTGGEGS